MRMHIWKSTDWFGEPKNPTYLNVDGVQVESEVPLCYHFNHTKPPIGTVTDIRVEDGEITGEVNFFTPVLDSNPSDTSFFHDLVLIDGYLCYVDGTTRRIDIRYRLGMYANALEFQTIDDKKTVMSCIVREVSLVPEEAWPMCEENANRTGGANPGAHIELPKE